MSAKNLIKVRGAAQKENLHSSRTCRSKQLYNIHAYYTGGLNHLPYLLSISVSMTLFDKFSTKNDSPK